MDNHKRFPCTTCGKLIYKSKTGLCLVCYNATHQLTKQFCKVCHKPIRTDSHTGLCLEHYEVALKNGGLPHREYKKRLHRKMVLCTKCQKPIGKNKTGLCLACYLLKIAKHQAIKNHQEEIHHVKTINAQSNRLHKNYHPTPCKDSPSGYHRWLINSENVGKCFYCDIVQKMQEMRETKFNAKPLD
jgi:hypothetical protein